VVVRPTARVARKRVAAICLAFPEAVAESATGQHDAYLVLGKKFAYFLDDHHGDGRVSLCCRAAAGVNTMLVEDRPERFFIPPYMGPRGWAGYYLDVPGVDWDEAEELLRDSWLMAAPKRLAAQLQA
jgi:hypothetical protein